MPEVKLTDVVSCSSEEIRFPASNLINSGAFKKWKCIAGQQSAVVILQLSKQARITSIDIGNEGSAFVEVLVGRSSTSPSTTNDDYRVLLPSSLFMNPNESRSEINMNRVRMFVVNDLIESVADEKWDRIKIVCTQPFNTHLSYGLSFIRVIEADSTTDNAHSSPPKKETLRMALGRFLLKPVDDDDKVTLAVGSQFNRRGVEPQITNNLVTTSTASSKRKKLSTTTKDKRRKEQNNNNQSDDDDDDVRNSDNKAKDRDGARLHGAGKNRTVTKDIPAVVPTSSPIVKTVAKDVPAVVSTPPSSTVKKPMRQLPFDKLLSDVTFVLSGFENPQRSILRQFALDMGANYRADWTSSQCTHLIGAFANTPKCRQVRASGGKMVTKEWIEQCYRQRRRLPWRRFALNASDQSAPESDEEIMESIVVDAPSSH